MPAKPFRLAKSLEKLRAQINAKFPNRGKKSDGWIGDPAHQTTDSDHNPHIRETKANVVSAIDITHDPAHGCDANKIAKSLIAKRDPRVKYVISNGMKAYSYAVGKRPAWTWGAYKGKNPHDHHFHISVLAVKAKYDSAADWKL